MLPTHPRFVRLAAVCTFLLVLAGCAQPAAPLASPSPTETSVAPPAVSASLGAIEGVVLDSAQLPVEAANVTLFTMGSKPESLALAITPPDGSFVFSLLEPANYRLVASRPGYGDAAIFVEVRMDDVTRATLRLSEIPGEEPYVDVTPWTGIIACGFAVVLYSDNCELAPQVQGSGSLQRQYNVTEGHRALLIETTWAGQDAMDNWVRWRPEGAEDWFYFGFAIGTPGLRMPIIPLQKAQPTKIATLTPKDFPDSDQPVEVLVQTFYDGRLQKEANSSALFPACQEVMGYCAGAGVAASMKFDQFVSVFVNAAPPNLAAYSALPKP